MDKKVKKEGIAEGDTRFTMKLDKASVLTLSKGFVSISARRSAIELLELKSSKIQGLLEATGAKKQALSGTIGVEKEAKEQGLPGAIGEEEEIEE